MGTSLMWAYLLYAEMNKHDHLIQFTNWFLYQDKKDIINFYIQFVLYKVNTICNRILPLHWIEIRLNEYKIKCVRTILLQKTSHPISNKLYKKENPTPFETWEKEWKWMK
jgi:hypothetical protein